LRDRKYRGKLPARVSEPATNWGNEPTRKYQREPPAADLSVAERLHPTAQKRRSALPDLVIDLGTALAALQAQKGQFRSPGFVSVDPDLERFRDWVPWQNYRFGGWGFRFRPFRSAGSSRNRAGFLWEPLPGRLDWLAGGRGRAGRGRSLVGQLDVG
jgi:hypothetical protein